MATNRSSSTSLGFELTDISTLKASCERLVPYKNEPQGTFHGKGKFGAKVGDSPNQVHVSFEQTIVGAPKGAPIESAAFTATCVVGGVVQLETQEFDLQGLANLIGAPLYYLAVERCRSMIASMGYPLPPVRSMPPFQKEKLGPSRASSSKKKLETERKGEKLRRTSN